MRRRETLFHFVAFGLMVQSLALAVPKHTWLPTHWVPKASTAPVVDGDLSDTAWSECAPLGPFTAPNGEAVSNRGLGKVTWDSKNLYLAFDLQQPGADKLKATQTRRDSDIYTENCVEVFIDTKLDFRTYFHFLVNIDNVQRDELGDVGATPMYDVGFDAEWQSATRKTSEGWTVELAIPLLVLGLAPNEEHVIGLNLCRNESQSREISCWSPTGGGFHEPARFGMVALTKQSRKPALEAEVTDVGALAPGVSAVSGTLKNLAGQDLALDLEVRVGSPRSFWSQHEEVEQFPAGGAFPGSVSYTVSDVGPQALSFVVRDLRSRDVLYIRGLAFSVPLVLTQKFGYRLPAPLGVDLWWAESTYKIMKQTPAPERESRSVIVSAARREWEPFQIVLRSASGLRDVSVSISDFRRGKATLPASAFQVLKVEYVPVKIPTDAFGSEDDYPDPLPPLKAPFDVAPNENAPVWVLAHIPANARAGEYRGQVTITATGLKPVVVPVQLRVFDFALTEETHTRTAYGLGLDAGFLGLKEPADQETAWENHLACFRDHRLSPYSPMARHPVKYEIHGPRWQFTNGDLQLVCDQYSNKYFTMNWKGKPLASLSNTMTQFEKEGVGWKGTGVGWPGISHLKEVRVLERDPNRWVLEVTGENVGSSPASRRYEITFQLFVPAGQPWFATRMVRFKNSDEVRYQMQGYFYITTPASEKREVAKGQGYALWFGEGRAVGAVSFPGDMVFDPSPLYVQKTMWLEPGQEIPGYGPTMVFVAGDAGSSDEAKALVEKLRATWGNTDPAEWKPAGDLRLAVEEKKEVTVTHDFADFDRAASKYLDQWKLNGFNFADFGAVPETLGAFRKGTPEYAKLHAQVYGTIAQHLRERGWLDEAYCYWFDEPSEEQYDFVNEGMDILGRSCPGLTRLLTEQVEGKLIGHVDLWVPVLSAYDPKKCQARQKAGDHVWWYVCCGPRAPYPNDFIDHPAINHRIRYWMMEKYGVEGDLYWATTYYAGKDGQRRNPWESGMSVSPDGGYWGNGDGMLLYPACRQPSATPVLDPPVVSQRVELIRDGLEDLEYFWTLRQALKELEKRLPTLTAAKQEKGQRLLADVRDALAAPDRLAKSLTEYTKDPQDLLRERQRIAELIQALHRFR